MEIQLDVLFQQSSKFSISGTQFFFIDRDKRIKDLYRMNHWMSDHPLVRFFYQNVDVLRSHSSTHFCVCIQKSKRRTEVWMRNRFLLTLRLLFFARLERTTTCHSVLIYILSNLSCWITRVFLSISISELKCEMKTWKDVSIESFSSLLKKANES